MICCLIAGFVACNRATSRPASISLSFLGTTNNAGTNLCVFVVSNSFPRRVAYRSGLSQVTSNSIWPSEVMLGPSMGLLSPGQGATFAATVLTNDGSWRVPLVWASWSPAAELWFQATEWFWENLPKRAISHPVWGEVRLHSAPRVASFRINYIEGIAR
jgi:hypothetical protein